jgi:predicted esterase YcpF (UPF0227 family)
MNILYLHGYASEFNPESDKVRALGALGTVTGINLDYTRPFDQVLSSVRLAVQSDQIDLVVGTSMGGFTASHAGVPFVAINPAIQPRVSLLKYLGDFAGYNGQNWHLTADVVAQLPDFNTQGSGLILLDQADELLDSEATRAALCGYYPVLMFPGGNHRFSHMPESVNSIRFFYNTLRC